MVRLPKVRHRLGQRGVALVTALLVVALTTIMAVSLASRQYMDVRRTGNIMLADQAYLYALALESFAGQLLKAYRDNQQQKYDDLEQFQQAMFLFQSIPVEGGTVSANVEFPEAKFNVNTLIDKNGKVKQWERTYYSRLLTQVLPTLGMDISFKESLIDALLDWLDPDDEARSAGAEDSVYEAKDMPYKAANRMMSSISELYLVDGYTKELLNGIPGDEENEPVPGLLHYLTALPDRNTTLNINLMEEPKLILAMASHIDEEMAQELLDDRPFQQVSDFTNHKVFKAMAKDPNQRGNWKAMKKQLQKLGGKLDVQSSYFLLKGQALVGQSKIKLNSLLYANTSGTKLEVVSRAIGTKGI